MKRSILFGLFLLAICLPLAINGCGQKASKEIILASFDKQVVTASELEKEISELPEWKQDKYKDQAGREEYLTLMAESRMILGIAKERKLDQNPNIIKEVKNFQEEQMRTKLSEMEVDNKVKISDLDVEKYYAEHKADYIDPEMVVVTEITLKSEDKAKEVMETVKSGADFTELAKEMDSKGESFGPGQGNGGKTRPFSRDSYSSAKTFVDTAFSMTPGEISDIIVQPLGDETYYMIVRKDEHRQSRQKELSEVKDDAKRSAESDAKEERKKNWINQLKEEKKVKVYPDRIPKDPEPNPEEAKEGESQEKPAENKEVTPAKDEILAEIGKIKIMLSELNKNISEMPEWKQDRYKSQEGKKKYLDELVEEKLLTIAAYDNKLDKDPEISRQAKEYRDQLMLKELVKIEIDDKIKIDDSDLEKYYEEHKEEYVEPEKVVVTEVTFKDEAKAKEVLERIKAGEDFTALAKEINDKGESFGPGQGNEGKTRPFSKDAYSSAKNFVDTAFSLDVGVVSDIIVQPMGNDTFYMIIRKDEHKPSRQQELSEVKDDVQSNVEREKKRARIDQWLDEVKKAHNFKLFLDRIPAPVVKLEEAQKTDDKGESTESAKPADTKTEESSQEKPEESK